MRLSPHRTRRGSERAFLQWPVLFHSSEPPGEGYALTLANAPGGLAPLDYHGDTPAAYRHQLRTAYVLTPQPFFRLVSGARRGDLTIVSADRPDLAAALYRALVAAAETQGWHIAGDKRRSPPKDTSGRYVP